MTTAHIATKTRKHEEDQSSFVLSCLRGCILGVAMFLMGAPAAARTVSWNLASPIATRCFT